MATPEERKAKLQAAWQQQKTAALSNLRNPNTEFAKSQAADQAGIRARRQQQDAQSRARVAAKAPELYASKRQYADPGQFAGNTLPGGAPQPLQPFDPTEVKQPSPGQSRLSSIQQRSIMQRMAKQQAQKQQAERDRAGASTLQNEFKKNAKAAFRRGLISVVNFVAAALDLSSVGITFIIDVCIYIFTLGWLNLEMIYGRWFVKGKSRYISPLSWDPIPMPVDKNAVILSVVVVAADLALGVAIVGLGIGGTCLLHDVVKVTSTTTMEAVAIGSSIAQGASSGLCLGGIIASMLSL